MFYTWKLKHMIFKGPNAQNEYQLWVYSLWNNFPDLFF